MNSILLTGFMTLIVSGVSTLKAIGLADNLIDVWISAWLTSWSVAIPVMYFVAPGVRALVAKILRT